MGRHTYGRGQFAHIAYRGAASLMALLARSCDCALGHGRSKGFFGITIAYMNPIRKPRVFLSHAKKDVEFIRKLDADLRAAHCDTWIDDIELRSGQPWLDQIFAAGLPSCEIVLCYVTANSIESAVFKQEMDARLLQRLHDGRVSLLVYVASANLRSQLRLDLQRLQMPEFGPDNYNAVLPRVVAEIWRSYSESLVISHVESEKVRRLEAEMRVRELEDSRAAMAFSASEESEFSMVWTQMDRAINLAASIVPKASRALQASGESEGVGAPASQAIQGNFVLSVGTLFRLSVFGQKFRPSPVALQERVYRDILLQMGFGFDDYKVSVEINVDVEAELLRYGFVERQYVPAAPAKDSIIRMMYDPYRLMFTPKFDRFGFWLEHKLGAQDILASSVRRT